MSSSVKVEIVNNREHNIGLPTGEQIQPGFNLITIESYEKCKKIISFNNLVELNWLVVKTTDDKKEEAKSDFASMSHYAARKYIQKEQDPDILIELYPTIRGKALKKLIVIKLDMMGV